ELIAFYDRRLEKLEKEAEEKDKDAVRATEPRPFKLGFSPQALAEVSGRPAPPEGGEVRWVEGQISPLELYKATRQGTNIVRPPELIALSLTESFVVYFKISLICGFVLASPWVFWQIWSFVAAGMYPHEKRLVHYFLPFSCGLFVAGAV